MTSIMDQYEQASQSQRQNPAPDAMVSSGYINMQQNDNRPMFSKRKMNLTPSDLITHAGIANDFLVLAMANGKLFRMDLNNPECNEEINYTKFVQPNSKLTNLFLDPLGQHLLLTFIPRTKDGQPETLYLHRKSFKPKQLTKSRSYEVTEVGWNMENISEQSTGLILLGTSQGHILETELQADSDTMFTASHQYWKQIFDIGRGRDMPITGLQYHRVGDTNKYYIIVTTPARLYQFIGQALWSNEKPSLHSIFHQYLTMPEKEYQDIHSTLNYSKLQFFYDREGIAKTFAWLTESGLYYGLLSPAESETYNSVIAQGDSISYPAPSENEKEQVPLNLVLTEFHAILMFTDRVKVVSLLSQELVLEDIYSEVHGKLKTIVRDTKKRTVWAITDKTVFRYKVIKEERNLWKIYSDKEQFDLAKEYCYNNPALIDIINVKQAELLFSQKQYKRSAAIYAETQTSFETLCLKFIDVNQIEGLKVYLTKRLDTLTEEDKTLVSMIVIWMTEIYLSQLGEMRRAGKESSDEYSELQSDFEVFLLHPKVGKCMQYVKSVIYDLMSSHGDKYNLMKLIVLNEDHENAIAQNIYNKHYIEALEILKTLRQPDLFYQFASVLIDEVPIQTVNALISQGNKLSPAKLLPAFLSCVNDKTHADEIIRYLDHMVQHFNVKDKAIHNYLLTLYAENDHFALMRYLSRQGRDIVMVNYDVHYALRLCRDKGLSEACVQLSSLLGLWEAGVELALRSNLPLAKATADLAPRDGLKRQLWLNIAEHVITKNQDLNEAMLFLEECPLIKIEDILPFFSDVVTIDHFREPICRSLQENNNKIEEMKAEMEEATRAAEMVRSEIQSFRGRSGVVLAGDACCVCALALLLRPFYLFPCGHRLHADCLAAETTPTLSEARRNKLADVQRQLCHLSKIELATVTISGLTLGEELRNQIDDIIANECVFCGEYMISCIDKPFIADEDWDRVMEEWK